MTDRYPLTNVLQVRARLGECPVWDAAAKRLYWVDVYNYRVHQFDPATGSDRHFDVGDVVGCIGLVGTDQLILGQRDRLTLLNTASGQVTPLHILTETPSGSRFNDGKCDPQGRFWVGSLSEEPEQASLYRYDPDGSFQVMETGLTISNGLGWSPDGTAFYLTDSQPGKIYVYEFDPASGTIANRRVLIDFSNEPVEPDGLAIDTEGCLWSALWNGWRIVRFDPDGQEMLRVELPIQCPTCCTFGGDALTDLYITTASVGLSQQEIEQSFCSGDLFCLKTDVQGTPSYRFA